MPITRSKLTRVLILQKLKKVETDVSSLIDVVFFAVISFYLYMSKTTQEIFSMRENYTQDHVRENAHIGMPIKTSTDYDIIAVPVGNLINQLNLGLKLVGITSDRGTNLVRYKTILEITFSNTGVFNLEKHMC